MRLFLKKIAIAIVPIVLIFLGSYIWSISHISSGNYYSIPKNVHSVVFGHSHSACAFNDTIIEGFYNLSQNTEGYPYTYFKVKKVLEENQHIENILVEYTNNQITPWASDRIYGLYLDINMPRMIPVSDKKFILKTFYMSGNLSQIVNAIYTSYTDNLSFIFGDGNNYLKSYWHTYKTPTHIFNGDTTTSAIDFNKEFIDIYSIQRENLQYLHKIKTLCQAHQVNLIFTRSPMPRHVRFSNESTFLDIKETFFSEIPFLDFRNYPMDIENFADNLHVNSQGSQLFSRFFNANISREEMLDEAYIQRLIEVQSGKPSVLQEISE